MAKWSDRFAEGDLEGLRAIAISYAQDQQHSGWPREHLRYPKTKNYYLVDALNQYFRTLGFEEFCVEEHTPKLGRVKRFAVPHRLNSPLATPGLCAA